MAAIAIPIIGWFVGPVIKKFIEISNEYMEGQISGQTRMKKKLEMLQENLPEIQSVVDYATQAQFGDQNPALNEWLWKLRDAFEEADDLLDEIEYSKYKKQVAKNNWKTNLKKIVKIAKRDRIFKRLEEMVNKLDKVSAKVSTFLHLVKNAKQEQQKQHDDLHKNREEGSLPKNVLIGRGEDMKSVIRWLRKTSNEEHPTDIASTALYNNVSVLSIVGHGGMGKTTLLQHVYEDEITKEFNLKMWVCVSNNFDVKGVIINMLESLQNKKPELESLDALQHCLKSAVSSKKFLLVLDDIWGEDEENDKKKWEKVLAPLAYGKMGSKILVTTRMDSVAAMITKVIEKKKKTLILQGLKEDECLKLLETHAFVDVENPEDHRRLKSITVGIAKKLLGSPLAAKVIGGALSSSLDERYWITVLNSDFRSAEFGQNDILPILRLSYMFLPRHLQNCFAFCCMFPQDHEFDKDDLVRMWIALGFIQSSVNQEDIGGRYFDVLVKKSFFDKFQSYYNETRYKMHDLLHELAQSISAQECFRVVRENELHSRIPETVRHIYVSFEIKNLEILKQIGKYKRLRSLFLRINKGNEEIVDALTEIFQSLRSIRLLYIKRGNLRLIPEAIGNLVHLRYLKIDSIKGITLPSSFSKLYHLLFIIFYFIDKRTHLDDLFPRDMNNLFNLRYLKLPWNYVDGIHGINGIGKLRSLQELNGFSVKNEVGSVKNEVGYSIQELEHMNELRLLRIKLLENVRDVEQACKAKLREKRNLTDLSLEWGDVSYNDKGKLRRYMGQATRREIVDLDLDERVLDNLHPHSNLKILRIHLFMGIRSPFWLNNVDLMSNLEHIQLDKCLEWQTLPPFGKLPFLKTLRLINMPKAKCIDYNYYRNEKDCVFPSLELLYIKNLDAMEDLFDPTITDDCFFPCLTELYLLGCPNLKELSCLPPKLKLLHIYIIGWKTLSCRSISKSIPLEILLIQECPNITWTYLADKITDDCFFPCFTKMYLRDCPNLNELPCLPPKLKSLKIYNIGWKTLSCRSISKSIPLEDLYIEKCPNITWIYLADKIKRFAALRNLGIDLISLGGHQEVGTAENCRLTLDSLQICDPSMLLMEPLRSIASLKKLRISSPHFDNDELVSFSSEVEQQFLQVSSSLFELRFYDLGSLRFLPSLESLSSLQRISIHFAPQLQVLPNFPASLKFVELSFLESLQCLSSLSTISSLRSLRIEGVPLLQQLPDLPSSLGYLLIIGCHEELRKRYNKISGFDQDKIAHIPNVDIF